METRNTLRVPVDLEVIWKIDKKINPSFSLVEKSVCRDKAFNISAGGMGIIAKHYLPIGLRIKLVFSAKILGLNKIIGLKAEVRYCKFIKRSHYKCGIKFIDVPAAYSSKLMDFIAIFEKRKEPRIALSE